MVDLFTAGFSIARPFVEAFHLKKEAGQTRFQVFSNEEAGMRLTVTGEGAVGRAVAAGSVLALHEAACEGFSSPSRSCLGSGMPEGHFLVSVERYGEGAGPGEVFLCNQIRTGAGEAYYPDLLYRHPFLEEGVLDDCAAALYQAGSYFLGPHQMLFFGVRPRAGEDAALLLGEVAAYVRQFCRGGGLARQEDCLDFEFWEKADRLCAALHCSKAMEASVVQCLRYCALAGVDEQAVLNEMRMEQKFPCRDKREGKRCFEEFKRRLF